MCVGFVNGESCDGVSIDAVDDGVGEDKNLKPTGQIETCKNRDCDGTIDGYLVQEVNGILPCTTCAAFVAGNLQGNPILMQNPMDQMRSGRTPREIHRRNRKLALRRRRARDAKETEHWIPPEDKDSSDDEEDWKSSEQIEASRERREKQEHRDASRMAGELSTSNHSCN